ncbi:hypothetical protein C1646_768448 [Rhizophagus diaphanus]|nr:hypothetical protein C1646_768448 [Rhizophagus diaphanus] [Rhizophagus sp. MUCL 43196]
MTFCHGFFIYAYKKLLLNLQSIDSLRELNSKLLVEIAELRKENAEIPELREKLLKFSESLNFSENAELKSRVGELEARLALLEQGSVVDGSLVDEAQRIYRKDKEVSNRESADQFWMTVKSLLQEVSYISIMMFAAYGYSSNYAELMTPVKLPEKNSVPNVKLLNRKQLELCEETYLKGKTSFSNDEDAVYLVKTGVLMVGKDNVFNFCSAPS